MNPGQEHSSTFKITITGQVQGVGFRPFIYRLAKQHKLNGWVKNCSGEVVVLIQGEPHQLKKFQQGILSQHPPLAAPEIAAIDAVSSDIFYNFVIEKSAVSDNAQRHIPPDYFTCDDCLAEMNDPKERRYRYPFINCTQCGPRYTIIKDLPYDRPNTSMQYFPLCDSCLKEYGDTLDRRFHAQPLACSECGPELSYISTQEKIIGNEVTLKAAVEALKQGKILALKGVGGYHLICDASNELAVQKLRDRKHRPDKPLAVMFNTSPNDGLQQLRQYCLPSDIEAKIISSPQRPIVLLETRRPSKLATAINPGLNEVGAMLPYSPLHYLILNDFSAPLVATSGNLSDEPVLTDNEQAQARLSHIADAFVQHNRPILRPADDSVVRIINQQKRLFRIGRGMAPLEIKLPFNLAAPVLATGGHMKNTITLAWDNRAVISPHIGELDSRRSSEVFAQVITDLCHLYRVQPQQIICDAHPDYYSSRYARDYARSNNIPLTTVQHHKAHASIVYGEFDNTPVSQPPWLVFCWDGTGLGDDLSIWGGEGFYGRAGNWQRVTSIKPFYLQGGDKAAKEPWRSACSLLWETGLWEKEIGQATAVNWQTDTNHISLAFQAWKKRLNTIKTSSMGRLFDAASALLSLGDIASFEGQGPMQLEALLSCPINHTDETSLPLYEQDQLLIADWSDMLPMLLDASQTQAQRSHCFHARIAETLVAQAIDIKSKLGDFHIGLSGGVFQNKHLCEYVLSRLQEENFTAFLPATVPYNDAGLSYGQMIETIYAQRNQIL